MPPFDKLQETQMTQALQLLADFRLDVPVARMQARQLVCKTIHLGKRKFPPIQFSYHLQHIQRPPSRFQANLLQGSQLLILLPYSGGIARPPLYDQRNPGILRQVFEHEVTPDPAATLCRSRKGRPFFEDLLGKNKPRNQNQVSHRPFRAVVV